MTFSELLNQYMETLSCTAKELSDASGVSQATISRYRHGEIKPPIDGSAFSAIPVFLLEGGITVCASFLKPIMTDLAMDYLSLIGSTLIFCVGLNLVWGKKVRVANMLPAVVFAVIAAFLPV